MSKAVELDTDKALRLVEEGLSYDDIAVQMGVDRRTIIRKLDALPDSAHMRAREASAEAWLDRGFEQLTAALDKGGNVDPSAARAYEQACARRAALRNPLYREKQALEHSGPNGGPVAFQAVERLIVDSKAT